MSRIVVIDLGPCNGISSVNFAYNRTLSAYLGKFPGCKWSGEEKCWHVPNELIMPFCDAAAEMRYQIEDIRPMWNDTNEIPLSEDVLTWQREAIEKCLRDGTLLVNFETGLGKSRTAIEISERTGRTVVVCPASVRGTWLREWQKWGPPDDIVHVVWPGDADLLPQDWDVLIVSYEWLRENVESASSWSISCLIFDELHMAKNGKKSKGEKYTRSEATLALSEAYPRAIKVGLTATPIGNEIIDIWHQLHVLSPGRFSSWMRFVKDYMLYHEGTYGGIEIDGVNPDREEELKWRISQQSIRKTKAEVAHLLPSMTVDIQWHRAHDTPKTLDVSRDGLDRFARNISPLKVQLAVDEIIRQLEGDTPIKIAVITHLISTAENIAAMVQQRLRELGQDDEIVELVHGEIPTKKRNVILCRACLKDRCVLVATMHSMGVGVDDLKVFKNVIVAEMYWSPMIMIQTLGRFCRLASPDGSVSVLMLALAGSVDEAIALALDRKISAALKMGGVGKDGELLGTGVSGHDDEDEDMSSFIGLVTEMIALKNEEDPYTL